MKIAAVSLYPAKAAKHVQASGVASYTKNLLKSLPLSGKDELHVVCEKLGASDSEQFYREDGFDIRRTFDRNYRFVRQIYQQLRKLQPDVTHIQQEVPLYGRLHTAYLLQWLLFALRKKPTVITFHHVVDLSQVNKKFVRSNNSRLPVWVVKLAFVMIYKPMVRRARAIIVHEPSFKKILTTQYGAGADKVQVIPHGVEDFAAMPTRRARQILSISDDRQVVLFMGYLAGYKGFDLLLEGFAAYAKTHPKALLLIGAGKHPKLASDREYLKLYEGYQTKAAQLIPEDQYRWVGFIDEHEVANYYSASDVSLYPYTISMSSSGPMSFAIGYEKPFLASDVFDGVLPEDVLFARTPEALAAKLESFFANPGHFQTVAKTMKKARLWSKVSDRTLAVYKGVAG